MFGRGQLVQTIEQFKLAALFLAVEGSTGRGKGQGTCRVDFQLHAVVFRAEVIGPVGPLATTAVGDGCSHHDELRQVVIE